MKNVFKLLSLVILLAAVVGGGYLVSNNQETRKGAASNETSSTILPSVIDAKVGEIFVANIWVNTGLATDKMQAGEFVIDFDTNVLEFVEATSQSGYTKIKSEVTNGRLSVAVVALEANTEKSGVFDFVKIVFKTKGGTEQNLVLKNFKMTVLGQTGIKDVIKNTSSKVIISGGKVMTPMPTLTTVVTGRPLSCSWCGTGCRDSRIKSSCPAIAPPKGKECVNVNNSCVVRTIDGTVTKSKEGGICGGKSRLFCEDGLQCVVRKKSLVAGGLGRCTVVTGRPLSCSWCGTGCRDSRIKSSCPAIAPPKGKECVNVNNSCVVRTIDGTVTKSKEVNLTGRFNMTSTTLGDNVGAFMSVNSGSNKVSAIKVRAIFDPNYFELISVTPIAGAMVSKNVVDKVTGTVELYLTWNKTLGNLPISPEFASVLLKTKKLGVGTWRYDINYGAEVSGVDVTGVSGGFKVVTSGTLPRVFIIDHIVKTSTPKPTLKPTLKPTNTPKLCTLCSSGLAKVKGNANCDNVVNSVDFELWRSEVFDKGGIDNKLSNLWQADFNCDSKVSGLDFEIWRATVFK